MSAQKKKKTQKKNKFFFYQNFLTQVLNFYFLKKTHRYNTSAKVKKIFLRKKLYQTRKNFRFYSRPYRRVLRYHKKKLKLKFFKRRRRFFFALHRHFKKIFKILQLKQFKKVKIIKKLKKKNFLRFNYFFFLLIQKYFNFTSSIFYLYPFHNILKFNANIRYEFLILYKRLRFIYKFRANYTSLRLYTFIYYSFFFKRFFLLLSFFKFLLVKKKKQKRSLYKLINMYRMLFYYKRQEIQGIQFLLHGTFDRHGRTRKFLYVIGKIKFNSFFTPFLFDWIDFATKYGVVSLKFWVFYHAASKLA